ncbi:MAG: PAS domain-containing sensor histidine kinase [Fidelibacterota bacterium]
MKVPIPSFRLQIFIVVFLLIVSTVLFYRSFFLESFNDYVDTVENLRVNERLDTLYHTFTPLLQSEQKQQLKDQVEDLLAVEEQKTLARKMFRRDLTLHSGFIFLFLTAVVLILFLFSFSLITRPLRRLQSATEELSRGNWTIQVKENRFSPLNDLILSFNGMINELEQNRNKLVQAEKESAWREMARILAHEIKNPLTPIRLSLERLEEKYRSGSRELSTVMERAAQVIREEIDNLESFANEFSQFARMPKALFSDYDLNEQLTEIAEPYHNQADIDLQLTRQLPPIHADRSHMKQVFTNILQNSIQSLNKGGHISVISRYENDTIIVSIKDDGTGIATEDLKHIFEPYFTRRNKGTGLGLAIVNRIVENHNGTIKVKSTLGEGTEVTICFPATQEMA